MKSIARCPSGATWTSIGRPSILMDSRTKRASGRLSSASRRFSRAGADSLWILRDGEAESRSFSRLGFDPDSSAIALNHPLANSQPDTGAAIFLVVMQPFENAKDFLLVLRVDPYAIIAN